MVELIDVLDENGKNTGEIRTKDEVHKLGLWHQTIHVWIYNSSNEILVQKRSKSKKSWPSLYDVSCNGHVDSGETPYKAAIRELKEELGIEGCMPKKIEIKKFSSESPEKGFYNNEFAVIYKMKYDDISKIKLLDGEVESVSFVDSETLRKEITNKVTSKNYVSNYEYVLTILDKIFK